jgi:hypothetical protein
VIGWATAAASTEPRSSVEMQEGEYIADVRRQTETNVIHSISARIFSPSYCCDFSFAIIPVSLAPLSSSSFAG